PPARAEPRAREHLLEASLAPRALDAVNARVEAQVFLHRQVLVQAEALGHVADVLLDRLGLAHDVEADDAPRARGGREDAAEHADGGGLAGAVRPEHAEDPAAWHPQRH